MNKQEIEALISRYYDGDTSLEEEKILLDHFNQESSGHTPEGDRVQFIYFKKEKEEVPSVLFSGKLDQALSPGTKKHAVLAWPVLSIAATVVVAVALGWFVVFNQYQTTHKILTHPGEQSSRTLPDGSVVWLNESTVLEYNNAFNREGREVWLQGEAYFDIQKDEAKQFIIHTGKVTTRVVGTSFNVRSYAGEQSVELQVTHGKVTFGADQALEVSAGTGACFDVRRGKVEPAFRANASAWKTKQLVFEDAALREVIQDLARYFHISLEAENPELLNCHFTGKFRNPELEEVLKVISYSLNIRHSVKNGTYVLSGPNCTPR